MKYAFPNVNVMIKKISECFTDILKILHVQKKGLFVYIYAWIDICDLFLSLSIYLSIYLSIHPSIHHLSLCSYLPSLRKS